MSMADLPRCPVQRAQVRDAEQDHPGDVACDDLGLAGKTAGNHTSSIFLKLQVATRAEAIARARQADLGGR
jgi:hypothetical protein